MSSSTFYAGVAAAVGEVAKDAKHLVIVKKAGGDFNPLVVECLGIRTLFALSVLHSIADHTTTHSGISPKVARRNLLPTTFSMFKDNAGMILRYWALQGNDDFPRSCTFFVVITYSLFCRF